MTTKNCSFFLLNFLI